MNILRPKTAKTGKMEVLDPKLSKMTAPNFGPNSLSGPSTVFQGSWSNQGGTPEDPPQEATICSTGSLLELEIAMWKLQLAIWKLNMALGKLQMAIWKIQMAIGKLKNERFEAKNGQNWQNGGKLKLAIWKFNMALGKLQMAMWKLKMATWKLKNEHFEAKNGQNLQNAGFGPQIVQNDSPQFWTKFFIRP